MLIGWIANVLVLVGIVFLSDKNRVGFLFNCSSNSLWAVRGFQNDMPDLGILSVVLAVLNIYSFVKWGRT